MSGGVLPEEGPGFFSFIEACQLGHLDEVENFLKDKTLDQKIGWLKKSYADGWNVLHVASSQRHGDIIRLFFKGLSLDQKMDLLLTTTEKFISPLHLACDGNGIDIINIFFYELSLDQKMLLLKKQDFDECTPLHVACLRGHEAVIPALLSGLSVNDKRELLIGKKDVYGRTPLDLAEEERGDWFGELRQELRKDVGCCCGCFSFFRRGAAARVAPYYMDAAEEGESPSPAPA